MYKQSWILEAESHIGLKEIPGKQHNPTIIKWLSTLKAWWSEDETPWCFTPETSILTENGWQRFDELTANRVYQSDESGNLSLTEYIPITKEYSGDVFDISSRAINITCDIGHKWWGYLGESKTPTFTTLDQLKYAGIQIPNVRSSVLNEHIISDRDLKLLAAYISDGFLKKNKSSNSESTKNIIIQVSRERKLKAIRELNPNHEYTQTKTYGNLTKTPLTTFRFNLPDNFYSYFKDYKILSPEFINSLSQRQAQLFLKQYSIFDGNAGESSAILYTTGMQSVNMLLHLCVMAGYHASPSRKRGGELTKKEYYTIRYCINKKNRTITPNHITQRNYIGKLYCVSVPQGRIVVRGVNSSPIVTGNCGVFTAHCLKKNNYDLPKHWYRAKDWLNWGRYLSEPVYGCIVVFDRNGGGHVGFVVGKDKKGNLMVLGGNQGNEVNIRAFPVDRVVGYRYPHTSVSIEQLKSRPMPIYENGIISTNEA